MNKPHNDASLCEFILKGLKVCSWEKYLRSPTLAHSALSWAAFDKLLRKERRENTLLLRNIRKTCRVGYQAHLLN